MIRMIFIFVAGLSLIACSPKPPDDARAADQAPDSGVNASTGLTVEGAATAGGLTSAPPPSTQATTADALDTTTPEQRAQASAAPDGGSKPLGKTIVSLGSPTEPGLWLKTPLVESEGMGRVTNPANGKSSAVTLIPIEGPQTAGSRMSLPAMRLIEASLTDLTEVEVSLDP